MLSCKNETPETNLETEARAEQANAKSNSEKSSKIKDCDDFLNTYEKWANDLIELMAKHKDDPVTLATSPEYINTMMESTNYLRDWQTIAVSCAQDDSYEKRMKTIQDNLVHKQKELGLK